MHGEAETLLATVEDYNKLTQLLVVRQCRPARLILVADNHLGRRTMGACLFDGSEIQSDRLAQLAISICSPHGRRQEL
jgi:hypothetical protein